MPRNPTRKQQMAQARRMRERGAGFREIADKLGIGIGTAFRWVVPGAAERDRQAARDWKAANKNQCEVCGEDIWYTATHCAKHNTELDRRRDAGRERTLQAIELRKQGYLNPEIAERIGVKNVGMLLSRAHRYGLEVPRSPYFKDAA